jgi:hypothetical protein
MYVGTLSQAEQDEYRAELKSEERRAVIWLGILAIIVALDVWLRNNDKPEVFNAKFYNAFCDSPCAHITLYVVPFLDRLIYFWLGYAICIATYFSEDFFPGRQATIARRKLRVVGHFLLAFYPFSVGLYLLLGLGAAYLPDWLQTPNAILLAYLLGVFLVSTFEAFTGKRIFGKRSIFNKPVDRLIEFGREGTKIIAESLVHALTRLLGHPTTGSIKTRRVVLGTVLSVIELITISVAIYRFNVSGLNLGWVFGLPLYVFLIISAFIGLRKKRKQKSKDEPHSDETKGVPTTC